MGLFTRIFGKKQLDKNEISRIVNQHIEPSELSNFGGKSIWITVKSNSTQDVLENLELTKLEKVTWKDGMARIKSSFNFSDIFISEPIDGWVILRGWGLPMPLKTGIDDISNFINRHSLKFGECQYFVSQRTTDTAIWIKSINGEIIRAYVIGDDMSLIIGEPTKVEKGYEFVDLNSPLAHNDVYFESHIYPDLDHLLLISESWSINPSQIDEITDKEKGKGYIVTIK